MASLKSIEQNFRRFRDDRIIKSILKMKQFSRHAVADLHGGIVDLGDHKLCFYMDDKIIGDQIRRNGGWAKNETLNICAQAKTKRIFLDIGANIGTQTVYALMFGGFERAVCFEPIPKNIQALKANLAINNLYDRVTIIEAAAGREAGVAKIHLSENNGGGHSIINAVGSTSIDVPVRTVESVLEELSIAREDIGLCWIDVEGFEREVFLGFPSIKGLYTAFEHTPTLSKLTSADLQGWQEWAHASEGEIQWKSITSLNLEAFDRIGDILLR